MLVIVIISMLLISPAARAQTLTTLYTFCSKSKCSDGAKPYASLVQAADGQLWGTTGLGGNQGVRAGSGTVFKITPSGVLTTLYSFCAKAACADGSVPGGLVLAAAGNFYGSTAGGGLFAAGTIFKITSNGELTTIYNFCAMSGCLDGTRPNALMQATDGNLYGTIGKRRLRRGIGFQDHSGGDVDHALQLLRRKLRMRRF